MSAAERVAHKHTNWTGRPCPACNGGGERSRPECREHCQRPGACECPFSCPDCGGTGEEHGEVPAAKCGDAECPAKQDLTEAIARLKALFPAAIVRGDLFAKSDEPLITLPCPWCGLLITVSDGPDFFLRHQEPVCDGIVNCGQQLVEKLGVFLGKMSANELAELGIRQCWPPENVEERIAALRAMAVVKDRN